MNTITSIHENTKVMYVPCTCHAEVLEIVRTDWDNDTDYYICLKADVWYSGQGWCSNLKTRMRYLWQAFRKGSYCHSDIMVNRKLLEEMRDNIDELLKEPDVQDTLK